MHRLIETDAPAGAVVEENGLLWRVLGPSPSWAGEAECSSLTCPRCSHDGCRRVEGMDDDVVACTVCGWRDALVPGELDAAAMNTAIEELLEAGLWVEEVPETPPEILALRERVRVANNDLLSDFHFRYGV